MQKAASSRDNFFLEQLLAGLVSARAIPELIKLSQAPGMFTKVRHFKWAVVHCAEDRLDSDATAYNDADPFTKLHQQRKTEAESNVCSS